MVFSRKKSIPLSIRELSKKGKITKKRLEWILILLSIFITCYFLLKAASFEGRRKVLNFPLYPQESKAVAKANAIFREAKDKFNFAIEEETLKRNNKVYRRMRNHKPIIPDLLGLNEIEGENGKKTNRPGFIILGMHRSGTSMLAGLLTIGMQYSVGRPDTLIGPKYDNAKGFYERVDVVLQNDEFFRKQNVDWSANVINYDYEKALNHKKDGEVTFREGERALLFLNDEKNYPWLQKDPRMCIALRTWLPLLDQEPAILFTYRHPLEVAMSLVRRDYGIDSIAHGLRLWIVYNMRSIQNSNGLCRVFSSADTINNNPLKEVQRIADRLTSKCGVLAPPKKLTQTDVDVFVDPTLEHKKLSFTKNVLARFGNCIVFDYEKESDDKLEAKLYLSAMKMFCDFKTGAAYDENYEWATLP